MFLSKRNGIYYLWYDDDDGRRRKISTRARLKSDALKFLRSFDERREAIRRARAQLSAFSVDAVRYAETTLNKGTFKLYSHSLRNFQRIVGNVLLSRLTPQHFDQYKSERLQQVSPVSVNVELRTIRSAQNLAVRWELIERNPFSGLPLARVPYETPPYFKKADFQRLLDVVIFTVATGLRRGEVINPKWTDVDLKRRVLLIHRQEGFRMKTSKSRFMPLNNVALKRFRHFWQSESEKKIYLFCGQVDTRGSGDPLPSPRAYGHRVWSGLDRGGIDVCESSKGLMRNQDAAHGLWE